MTPRRLLLMLSASVAIHLGLVSLAFLVAGVGAGAVLVVDLIAELESASRSAPSGSRETSKASGQSRLRGREPGARPASSAVTRPPAAAPASRRDAPPRAIPGDVAEISPAHPVSPPAQVVSPSEARLRSVPAPGQEAPPARPDGGAPDSIEADVTPASGDRPVAEAPRPRASADAMSGDRTPPSGVGATRGGGAGPALEGRGRRPAGEGGAALARAGAGDGPALIPPEYNPYLQRLRRRVQESLTYPLAARRRGLSGQLELEVLVEPSGRVSSVRVISSSSHGVLDNAAIDAVKGLDPEPMPSDLPQRSLRIRLPLGFQLQ